MSAGMFTIVVEEVPILFPFEPYKCQIEYMRTVIRGLKTRTHAALESPTGTGKTLCLLCATCAWLVWTRKQPGSIDANSKILYTTRTHSQVSQVMSEFRRCAYSSQLYTCVLGAREHLCVHPQVKELKGHALRTSCNNLRMSRGCRFSNYLASAPAPDFERIMDIEDLVKEGATRPYCPYFYTRENQLPGADIVFCPYNYAMDSHVRAQELDMKSCILIIDEGHNLPSVCLSTTSVEISAADVATAVADTGTAILCVQKGLAEQQQENDGNGPLVPKKSLETVIQEMSVLKKVWCNIERALETASLEVHQETGVKAVLRPGDYVYEFLGQQNITVQTAPLLVSQTEKAIEYITTAAEKGGFDMQSRGLQTMLEFLRFVFPHTKKDRKHDMPTDTPHASSEDTTKQDMKQSYHFVLQETNGSYNRTVRQLCMWCLDCSVCMKRVASHVRCILVTSGTLTPIDTFVMELGIPFPHILQGPHVISASQVIASVCCASPGGTKYNSSFLTRGSSDYKLGVGQAIVNLCRVVPDGMLVFFPSYTVMNQTVEAWQAATTSVWADIQKLKAPFLEPKTQNETRETVKQFQITVDSGRGAVFFAVCRGKISEGIDFADRHGRCVIVVGIPYASRGDLSVFLRKQHIDTTAAQKGWKFSGDQWYRQEAIRSVNQAIGRVIRHKDDFGCVVLLDERFASNTKEISRWLQPYVQIHKEFMMCQRAAAEFFLSWKGRWWGGGKTNRQQSDENGPVTTTPTSAQKAAEYSMQSESRLHGAAADQGAVHSLFFTATSTGSSRQTKVLHPEALTRSPSTPTISVHIPSALKPQSSVPKVNLFGAPKSESPAPAPSTQTPMEAFLEDIRNHFGGSHTPNYTEFKVLLGALKTSTDMSGWKTICKCVGDLVGASTEEGKSLLIRMRDLVIPPTQRKIFNSAIPELAKREREIMTIE